MSVDLSVTRISKTERKLQKKIAKSQRTLLRHEGIETSETPTKVEHTVFFVRDGEGVLIEVFPGAYGHLKAYRRFTKMGLYLLVGF